MERQAEIYVKVAEKEELEKNLENLLFKVYRQAVGVKIVHADPLLKKYRKNSLAWKLYATIDKKEDKIMEDKTFVLRKYNDDKSYDNNVRMHAEMYNCFKNEESSKKILMHKFTELQPGIGRNVGTFLKPLDWDDEMKQSHEFFKDKNLTLVEHVQEKPFDERFDQKADFWDIQPALDPLVILMDRMPWFEKKSEVIKKLKTLELNDYTKGFMNIIVSSNFSPEEINGVKENFEDLVKRYMMDEKQRAIIQYDGYPWHNNGSYLLDLNGLCWGSKSLQFGASFGHPDIFNRIEDHNKTIPFLFVDTYQKLKLERLYQQYSLGNAEKNGKKETPLVEGFYLGAVCANSNLVVDYAGYLSKDEETSLLKTIKTQMKILSEKEIEKAKKINNIIEKKELVYSSENL